MLKNCTVKPVEVRVQFFAFCVTQTLSMTRDSPLVGILGCYSKGFIQSCFTSQMLFDSDVFGLFSIIYGHSQAFRKFLPLFDRVLVERFTADTVTKGGIMLPEKSQGKVLQAKVVAVGPGTVNEVITQL